MSTEKTQSFNQSYIKLKENVEKLRNSDTANIDELMGRIAEISSAYGECKERIQAVRKLLGDYA